ncbi:hypothetical protein MBT84_39195 [Streptomyces sp. MBT84]|uniref:hypothetical protein n=1 Tax=unclassified Streptomyces TaxID=2593676 RepID=UPI001C6EF259|nr:hypothetical protein [Streptomyces sp. MBT84]MBW8705651.1 hypothetical protein [Streptomyces sp. MBT84]
MLLIQPGSIEAEHHDLLARLTDACPNLRPTPGIHLADGAMLEHRITQGPRTRACSVVQVDTAYSSGTATRPDHPKTQK